MRAHTPQQSTDASRRRSSTAGHRTSMGSSLPVARSHSRIAIARASNTQPSFDFLTGAERPPSRDAFRTSVRRPSVDMPRAEVQLEKEHEREKQLKELEDLKTELKTLKYTIDNHKQEEELAKLRHESELRDVKRKAEEDFKKLQIAGFETSKALRQNEILLQESNELKDSTGQEKVAFERRIREIEQSKHILEEEVEDIRSDREEAVRRVERKAAELEARNETLQRSVDELQQDSDRREAMLREAQQQVSDKDTAYGTLETEVLQLRAKTGDTDTLGVIKRELSEQVAHIRKLEVLNREQSAELKHLKKLHKSIEVVEEEKRSLQRRLEACEGLENELGEAKMQRQRLEDERLAWTAYLDSQAGADGKAEFESPEELARAFVAEQLQNATLVERIGALEPELAERDNMIQSLEGEKSRLSQEVEKLKTSTTASAGGNIKVQQRLERQKALAIKEVEYLREQLKAYDSEDSTFQPDNFDEAKVKRIQELEDMVDQYRQEVGTLTADISAREDAPALAEPTGMKRPHPVESEDVEQVGRLSRKNRKLQDELSTTQATTKLLKKELSVVQERLDAAMKQGKTRILSLRSNPTSDLEAIKQSTLKTLRQENADLLAQLKSGNRSQAISSVPLASLEASQRDTLDVQAQLASERKRVDRLMKVWGAKSAEFRESVKSLLGWEVAFMKDGKMKVTSYFYPCKGDEENSIVFDGERGTMKISGGPESAFAIKIRDQIKFWVTERGSIPCFLAALTLEFYDEANKDGTLRLDV